MNQTTSKTDSYNAIVELLQSLPNISDSTGQQSFVRSARLDERLVKQIQFGGPTAYGRENGCKKTTRIDFTKDKIRS